MEDQDTPRQLFELLKRYGDYSSKLDNIKELEYPMPIPLMKSDWFGVTIYFEKKNEKSDMQCKSEILQVKEVLTKCIKS